MREYGTVSPKFWIGATGKLLRGDPESQVLAMYLMTSPHSTMTGVFHCPVLYMAHETGLGMEGASKALTRLIEAGFCEYEEASEFVFVVRMAAHQIAESLKPGDKRILGIARAVENMPAGRIRSRFLDVYGDSFLIPKESGKQSPFEAPSKPLQSQEQEQEQEQEQKKEISNLSVAPRLRSENGQGQEPAEAQKPIRKAQLECPHLEILALWAEVLPDLPQHLPSLWDGPRAQNLRARWRKKADEKRWETQQQGLDYFRTVFVLISQSSFLCGRTTSRDPSQSPFQATLEWVVRPVNWAKVLEQRYNDKVAA